VGNEGIDTGVDIHDGTGTVLQRGLNVEIKTAQCWPLAGRGVDACLTCAFWCSMLMHKSDLDDQHEECCSSPSDCGQRVTGHPTETGLRPLRGT
jgi:hypothetical protein